MNARRPSKSKSTDPAERASRSAGTTCPASGASPSVTIGEVSPSTPDPASRMAWSTSSSVVPLGASGARMRFWSSHPGRAKIGAAVRNPTTRPSFSARCTRCSSSRVSGSTWTRKPIGAISCRASHWATSASRSRRSGAVLETSSSWAAVRTVTPFARARRSCSRSPLLARSAADQPCASHSGCSPMRRACQGSASTTLCSTAKNAARRPDSRAWRWNASATGRSRPGPVSGAPAAIQARPVST